MTFKIAAFGALNADSYEEFARQLKERSGGAGYELVSAGPYPNAQAVSEPGRPLRAEALQDDARKQELFTAVAADAASIGAASAQLRVMPCMSMIGFHDGVEKSLGADILRLADALADAYRDVARVGVIHMRPAKKRIEEIFGAKAVTPDDAQAAALLAAEEAAKQQKSSAPVEQVMRDIVEAWKKQGVTDILFARADAPKARHGIAGQVEGVRILSYFDILADAAVRKNPDAKPRRDPARSPSA